MLKMYRFESNQTEPNRFAIGKKIIKLYKHLI